jgi:autotransporter-associated beta strand protein
MVAAALLGVAVSRAPQAKAANLYWDSNTSVAGTGGTGIWTDDKSSNWSVSAAGDTAASAGTFSQEDIAFFTGTAGTATLGAPITIGGLVFAGADFTVTGNTLTLAAASGSPSISVTNGNVATVSSIVAGTSGLTKTGNGTLRLTNVSNSYTGTTTISRGNLIISSGDALGTDTSSVVVTGSATRGFGGGSLILDGTAGGLTLSRNLSLQGLGPISDRSSALVSVGNNTLSGTVTMAEAFAGANVATRITSADGMLTLSSTSTLNVLGTAASTLSTFGGGNQAGGVNYTIAGTLTGTGTLDKTGAGTLFLNPTNVSGFSGTIRVTSNSVTGTQGTIRITNPGVIGSRGSASTGASSLIDLNAGFLELRMNTPTLQTTGGTNANVYSRSSTNSTFFLDHAPGGDAVNGTLTLGEFGFAAGALTTFLSRNGYGFTFGAAPVVTGDNNNTITNSVAGTLTFTGAFWSNTNGTSRTFTIAGNGNTLISGAITAAATGTTNHNLIKTGSGLLTINNQAATLDGTVSVEGSLAIRDIRAIGAATNAESITLGNATTTAGNLIFGTASAPTAGNLSTSRPIVLNGTTANNAIYASQSGATGVTLSGTFTKPVAGNATFSLGGTNTSENLISSVIPALGTGGLTKNGPGLWALSAANLYTGATTITAGTLRLKPASGASDIIGAAGTNTIVFNVDSVTQDAGGVLQLLGFSAAATTEALGALTPTAGSGTVRLTAQGAGGTANLTFTSLGTVAKASGVNFDVASGGGGTITLTNVATTTATTLPGNGHLYINGTNFAISTSGVLSAPTYTVGGAIYNDAGGANLLVASRHNQLSSALTTAPASISLTSLRIGANLTMASNANLTVNTGAVANDGGILAYANSTITTSGTGGVTTGGGGTLVYQVPTGVTLTQNAPILVGTTGGFTKNGAGVLVIGGANAQSGATTINEGTVRLAAGGVLSSDSATSDLAIRQGATLDLNGVNTGTAIRSLNGSGSIVNGQSGTPAAATLSVGNNNGTGTFTGVIGNGTGGALSVTKVGTGAMSWLGSSTYTGVTTIGSTGLVTVNVMANGGVASGIGQSSAVASNLVFNGSTGGLVYAGGLLNGSLAVGSASASTDRLFTLAAAATGATLSSTATNGNAIVWSATGPIVNETTANATLVFTGTSTGDNTFNPQLVNSSAAGTPALGLSKTAAGQWNLGNSNNTYSGSTNIAEGILGLNNNGALSANSPLTFSAGVTTTAGVLQMSGTFTRNLAASAVAGTPSVTWASTSTGGGGFAAHSTGLVVAIGGTVSPTALTWASGGFVGTTGTQSLFLNSVSALAEVEFRNSVNLNGSVRTVNVLDNANTAADFAILSGVLSGTGNSGLQKAGAGILKLTGANSYTGVTDVNTGTLVVTSLGSSTGGATSSVGAGGVAMGNSNAVTLGNATTGGAILQYVGPGETSDRKIRFNSTTGAPQIHADGAGALILTNVVNDYATPTGAKTLNLRGSSTAGNTITSNLTNDAAATPGTLGITVDGHATWILSGNNTFTGSLTVSSGALGVGGDSATGTGQFIHTNGSVFASGADRTISNSAYTTNNTTTSANPAFIGDYSVTIPNAWAHTNTTTSNTITNGILNGKLLTIGGGLTFNAISAARTITFNGTGGTVLNVGISTSTAFGVNTTYSGTGILTLGGTINPNGGVLTVSSGTVKLGASDRIPEGATAANVTINPAISVNAVFDLAGYSETINGLTANSAGNTTIGNSSSGASTLTFGDNDQDVTFGGGAGANSITQVGGGAISLVKIGTGTANFTGTLANTGSTTVSGGTFNYNSATGTTGVSVASGAALNLKGGLTAPAGMTGVTLAAGGALSFASGLGQAMANLTTLSLGVGTGTAVLELDAGETGTDTLTLSSGAATAANTISLLIKDVDLSNLSQYTLISAPGGGLSGASYTLNLAGYTGSTLTTSDTQIVLNTGTLVTSDVYWNGGASTTAWSTVVTGSPDLTNFSSDQAGTTTVATLPGKGQKVIFVGDNLAGGAALSTTLEQPFKINALVFRASTTPANTPVSVTIAPGAVTSNSLTFAPGNSADGISMAAGSSVTVNISAPVVAQTAQTWTVTDAAQNLNISGDLSGAGNITKAGAGTVTFSAAGSGFTGAFAVNAGTVAITNATALSGIVALPGAGSAVTIGGTGAFYYNGTGSTVSNNLTLAGGTLSAGTGNQIYSGSVTVQSATTSTINMRDLNSAVTSTAARNINLSGVVSGTGALTLDSFDTLTGGNAENGSFTFNNGASTWSGTLGLTRGTAVFTNSAAGGTATPYFGFNGPISFNSLGRVIFRNVDGATLNRSATLNFAASSIGEFSVDNLGALASNFVVTQSGQVTLGAGSAARFNLADEGSRLNITGGVVLSGNASISTEGGTDADSLVTISGTGISGTGNLAINDEAGGWAVTSTRLAITAASTFTGNTTLNEGTLILGHKDALSAGSFTVTGASTLQASVVLSGADAFPNATALGAALTVSGSNSITFGAVLNPSGGDRTLTNSLTGGAAMLLSSVNLAETGASAARVLTLAGSSATSITALVNNLQNNTLTNSLTTVTLGIGTIALSETSTTGRTLTLGGAGNTIVTGVISNFNGVGGTAGILAKSGAGTLQLDSANTYSGGTTLSAGTVLLGNKGAFGSGTLTVSGTSTLQASTELTGANAVTNALALNASLTFSGNNSLQLSGPADLGATARTITANGAAGATLTLSGAISNLATAEGAALTLAGNATGTGVLSGGFNMTGDTADAAISSGAWTYSGGTSRVADDLTLSAGATFTITGGRLDVRDDFIVTGVGTVLNLNGTGVLSFNTATLSPDASLTIRDGAQVVLGANGAVVATEFDRLFVGQDADGQKPTLNMGVYNLTTSRLILGERATTRIGDIIGTGTLTVAGGDIDLFKGLISANLGSTGTTALEKLGFGSATLSGDNSALASTGSSIVYEGTLILDYSTSNATKLRNLSALDMRGGSLTLLGNAATATSQSVSGLTLASGGSSRITLTPGAGQDILLTLGAITRAAGQGTLRINLPTGIQTATNGVTTTTAFAGTIPGYLTVNDGTGIYFASRSLATDNLVRVVSTTKTDISTWLRGEDVINTGGGYTGTTASRSINSLIFDSASSGDVTIASAATLEILGGGIMVRSSVTAGTHNITGGTLTSGISDLIFTQDGAATLNVSSFIGGTNGLTKTGNGTLRLTNAGNNFTGAVSVQAGVLQVIGGNALGDFSSVVIADDQAATLQLLANETIGSLSGGNANTASLAGTVALGANNLTINQVTSGLTYAGLFSGTGTLIKNGAGDLTHTGSSNADFTGNLVINQGSFRLAGNDIGRIGSTAIFINGVGSELHINHDNNNAPDRVVNAAVITLNNTAPGRGLALRTTHGSSRNETIGGIVLGAGHNVVLADSSGGAFFANLISAASSGSNLTRTNKATTLVVGRNLGGVAYGAVTAPDRGGRISFTNAITGANAAVGGAGGDGSATASIFPYMIGQATSGAPALTDVGNSFVRLSTQGLRPLSTVLAHGEYTFDVAGYDALGDTTSNNVRFTATGGVAAAGAGTQTINSLAIDSTAGAVTLTGPGTDTLELTSGAFLSTGTAANNTSLTGFAGITTATNNEYIFFVTNNQFTLGSPLTTTAAALTKSGAGALILNDLTGNAYTGGTFFNQGLIEANAISNFGPSGALNFFGGGLRWATGSTFDVSARTVLFGTGGATFDTNSNNVSLANSIGGGGSGGFTKTGAGNLTFEASANYLGATSLQGSGRVILNGGANNRLSSGALTLSANAALQLGDSVGGASDLTVGVLTGAATNAIVGGGATASVLSVSQVANTTFAGSIGGIGANENNLSLTKDGVGTLTLSGAMLSFNGALAVNAGTLNITGGGTGAPAPSAVTVAGGATLNLANSAGQAFDLGSGALALGGATGAATLQMELGSTSAYDRILTSGAATASNGVILNLVGLSGFSAGNYDLITAASGLNGATYSLGTVSGGSIVGHTYAFSANDTTVRLAVAAATGSFYWAGSLGTSWAGLRVLDSNWSTDLEGTINAKGTPGVGSSVIFSSNDNTATALATTLDGAFTIKDLTFNNELGTGPLASISIAAGTSGTLTITPASGTAGIEVGAGAPAAITISAPMTLGASQTWTVTDTATILAVTGGLGGTANLIKAGAGILTLSGTNNYVGTTTVSAGVLRAGATNGFNQTSAHTVSAGATLRLNNFDATIGSLAGAGTVENGGTANARTLTVGGDNSSTTFSGILQNGGSFALALTKTGTGSLTLSGANTSTGNITVNGGVLNLTGSWTGNIASSRLIYGGTSATPGVVNVSNDLTIFGVNGSNVAGGVGVYNQSAGMVDVTGDGGTATYIAGAAGSYGYFNLTGGTFKSRNRFGYGVTSNLASPSRSVAYIGGSGRLDHTNGEWMLNYSQAQITLADSGEIDRTGATQPFGLIMNSTAVGGQYAVLNLAGGSFISPTRSIQFGNSTGAGSNNTAFINLAGGTLQVGTAMTISLPPAGANNAYLNFAGGTLKTTAAIANWIPTAPSGITFTSNIFGAIDNSLVAGAPSFAGGLTFDTNGFDSSLGTALRGATGSGVAQSSLSVSGGSGYVGAPEVIFTGGTLASGGTPAAGYALISEGALVGIVVTSPGAYTSAPTVTLTGGGGTGAAVTVGTLVENVSGGLTKAGGGTLTLSGANTYTGGTTVNLGTLALGANNVLADAGNVTVAGGTFNVAAFNDTVAVVSLQGGAITGSTGVLTSTSDFDLRDGTVSAILGGSVGLNKSTADTVTLSGANNYSGATTITGGTLAFSAANNLGNASATNTLTLNGATLSYVGSGSANLVANQVVTIGSSGATLNISDATGSLNLQGGIVTSTAANLTKTGLGTVSVTGSTNLNGGNVTVSAGALNLGFTATGAGALAVDAGATLNLYDGAATSMAITGLTLANGSSLGFDLGATGVNDVLSLTGTAVIAPSVSLNFNDLGSLGVGTYDLITVSAGTLNAADYVLGLAPSGLNYNFTTENAGQTLRLTTSLLSLVYWKGDVSGSWSANNAGDTNWASDLAGSTDLAALPSAIDTLVFAATSAVGPTYTTTLDGSFTADSLKFTANPDGVTAVTISQGTSGTLTLSPASANNGISVPANVGAITISAPIATGAIQTWEVIGGGANGSSLTASGAVTISHLISKTGAGVLTLSGTNTGSGGINFTAGTLVIGNDSALGTGTFSIGAGTTLDTGAGAVVIAGNNAQSWNGNFIFTGTNTLNLGTGAITLGDNVNVTVGNTLTVGGVIGDGAATFGLTKSGAGVLILNGANTYGGLTTLTNGSLALNGDNSGAAGGVTVASGATLNLGHANALGSGTLTLNGGVLNNTSGGALTLGGNVAQDWNGGFTFTGTHDMVMGSGAVTLGATTAITVTAGSLTVNGVIDDGENTFNLNKAGAGTLTLGGLNTYGGATTLSRGTLIYTADQILTSSTNVLNLGASAGSTDSFSLELNGASARFGGAMLVQTSNTVANTITIGAGESLRVDGTVTIGFNSSANSTTKLNITGASGTFKIGDVGAPTNLGFQLGNSITDLRNNAATLDMSGLGTFFANLGTGTFRVGDPTNASGGGAADRGSTLILAANSTIIATTITSDSVTSLAVQRIKLGSGTNILNANTISIGGGAERSTGTLDFNTSTGSVNIRALNGSGRAAMNVQNGNGATGTSLVGTVDFTGHEADLLLSTLAVGGRSGLAAASGTGTFSFDTGTLDATTVNIAARTGTTGTSGSVTGTFNLGGGTVTIGTVTMSTNNVTLNTASGTGDATSTLNISGSGTNTITTMTMGTLAITNTTALSSGNSDTTATANVTGGNTTVGTLTMGANASAANTATANTATSAITISAGSLAVTNNLTMGATTLRASNAATANINITGTGSLTVGGNIQYTNGLGTETNTVTLNGGTLDVTGGNIGSSAALITFNAQAGTLRNLAELNGGGTLTKSTSGTLVLEGSNTYTGATLITGGTLSAAAGALAGTSGITVNGAALSAVNYNLAATLTLDATATAIISGAGLEFTGAIVNEGATDDALDFSAEEGIISVGSLTGAGKTRFGASANITDGVTAGNVTVVGTLTAAVSAGTVSAGALTGNVSGGNVTVSNLLTGNVTNGTVAAGALTGNVGGGTVTVTNLLTGNVTAGTVSAGSMTGDVSSSVTITNLLTGAISGGTNSLGSLAASTISGGTTSVSGVASVTTLSSGTVTFNGATASIGVLNGGTVNLGTTALTVDSGSFNGLLAGASGSLIKATGGTLTISSENTFGGGTTINAGTIVVGHAGALGGGGVSVAVGATLDLGIYGITNVITRQTDGTNFGSVIGGISISTVSASAPATVSTVLTGGGDLTRTGGELTLTTANFYTGATVVSGSAAVIRAAFLDDASSSLGASALDNPANLKLTAGATLEFTGGTGAVTSRSFTVEDRAGISAATGAGALVFTSDAKIATTGTAPELTLSASNIGENVFGATLVDGNPVFAKLTIDGTGTWIIGNGANRFKGDVRIEVNGGTLGLQNGALPGDALVALGDGSTVRWEDGNTSAVKLSLEGGSDATLALGANAVTLTTAPVVTGTGEVSLTKTGAGTLTIGSGFSGATVNMAVTTGTLSVNGTLGDVTLSSGATLGGSGFLGAITAVSGSTIAPGSSPGIMNAESMALAGNTTFIWEVQDAQAGPGGTGYDKIVLSGSLDLSTATLAAPITLKIRSLQSDGSTIGPATNFGPPDGVSSIRSFQFASVQTGSQGVLLGSGLNISDVFVFDLSEFTYTGGGSSNAALWSIDWNQGTGAITLTAVPEPSTYGFGLGALALAAAAIRRRRKAKAEPAA